MGVKTIQETTYYTGKMFPKYGKGGTMKKKQVQYDIRDYSISEICVFIEDKDTGEVYKDCMEINTTQGHIETYFADKTEKLLGIDMTEDINDRHINHLKNLHDVNINEILNEYEETQEYLKNKNKNLGGN